MFFDVGIKDFIDVLLVALLLYYTYKLMKASGSIKVFTGILVFILIWLVVTQILEMKLLGSIFDTLMNVGVIARLRSMRLLSAFPCSGKPLPPA